MTEVCSAQSHRAERATLHAVLLVVCALFTVMLLTSCSGNNQTATEPPTSDVDALSLSEVVLSDTPIDKETLAKMEAEAAAAEAAANAPDSLEEAIAASKAVEERIAAGDSSAKICYLTLDDGPSENTQAILGTLAEKGVKATWFIQGNSPQIDMVTDIANAGHAIGLHTYSHDYATLYASDSAYFADLDAVQQAVSSRIGHTCDIVRFPGGTSNGVSANYCSDIMSRLTESVPAAGFQYFD